MPSVRLHGISATIDDETIFEKAKRVREKIGEDYRIIIEGNRITVEGDILNPEVRREISEILAS